MLKHAKEHSGSVVVQMRAQLADKEVREGGRTGLHWTACLSSLLSLCGQVEVARLKERLEASQLDQDALVAAQLKERGLVEQVKLLTTELMEAKCYHTPVSCTHTHTHKHTRAHAHTQDGVPCELVPTVPNPTRRCTITAYYSAGLVVWRTGK